MRAARITGTTGIDAVEITDVPRPSPDDKEVIVEVEASGVNYAELWIARGVEGDVPVTPGVDSAGTVAEVGADVTAFEAGDRVLVYFNKPCYDCEFCDRGETTLCTAYGGIGVHEDGGHAEYVSAPARNLISLPDHVSAVDGAAFSSNFGTAWRALRSRADVSLGDSVLVLGASGGVGHGAVQIADAAGAEVYACTSVDWKAAKLRELGVEHVINYEETAFDEEIANLTDNRGVDIVVTSIGGETYERAVRSLARDGTLVTFGATNGDAEAGMLHHIFWKQLNIVGSTGCTIGELEDAFEQLANGVFQPVVDSTISLDELPAAYRRLENREVFGKVVLQP